MIDLTLMTEAAREQDAKAEEYESIPQVLEGIGIDASSATYLAEQRGLRLYLAATGREDEISATEFKTIRNVDKGMVELFSLACLDGIAIGVRAKEREQNA